MVMIKASNTYSRSIIRYGSSKDIVAKNAGEWNKYHITIDYQNNNGKVILNGLKLIIFLYQEMNGTRW